MGGEEREARKSALFIHVFLERNQETSTPGSQHLALPTDALLVHQASVLLHFPRLCVGGRWGRCLSKANSDSRSESSGELGPGPCPRMTESESLGGGPGLRYFFFFLEGFLDHFNEYPKLRTIDR